MLQVSILNFLNINEMKKIRLIGVTIALSLFVLTACEKSEISSDEAIEGTYVGTLTKYSALNVGIGMNTNEAASAEITKIGNEMIEIHMFGNELDTLFILNYYNHRDSVPVCFTGDDFENMYGHMLGQGHMNGGMMNDMQNDETEWIHHLNDEHEDSDEHFGGFDMQHHSFGYRFDRMVDGITTKLEFQGTKS